MNRFNIPTLIKSVNLMGRKKYLFLAAILFFCGMEVFGSVLGTIGTKGAINGIANKDTALFLRSVLYVAIPVILWGIYTPICTYISDKVSSATIRDVKSNLCSHILKLPMEYLDSKPKGELISALSNDCSCLEEIYYWNLMEVLRYAMDGIGGVIIMAVIDWRFAIVVMSFGSLSVLITSHFSKKLEKIGAEQQRDLAQTNTDAYELIKAAKTIRLFNLQSKKKTAFNNSTKTEADSRIRIGKLTTKMNSVTIAIKTATYVGILFIGSLFVKYGLSDWGTVIALLSLKSIADMLFVFCVQLMAELQKYVAGVKRLFALQDVGEEQISDHFVIKNQSFAVSMKNVSFSYDNSNKVLHNYSMDILNNKLTVLVGKSGSGKSTILKILLALYNPSDGEVSFNGNADTTIKALRSMTAYVPQEAQLYGGSILNNITFEAENVSMQAVLKATSLAGINEFIESLPNGYDTVLLDDGKSLSGGQRQRISIARALIKDAPILLLDEITSALDHETEQAILKTIREVSKYKAVLWITHNQAIAESADEIYRL